MPDADAFATIEARLWAMLDPYRSQLVANSIYGLSSLSWPGARKHDFFAGVRVAPRHVAFHLMPVYTEPALLETVSPDLRARLKGKTTFDFTAIDEALLTELDGLTARAYAVYEARHAK